MKVKQLINVLGALNDTGKLACDMYSLDESEYYSQSQGAIAISEMEFSHVLRAFRKICDDDVRIDTQEGKVKELELENQRLVQQLEHDETVVTKESYEVMWDNCKKLEKQVNHWKKLAEANFISSVNDSETSDVWKEKYEQEVKHKDFWRKLYYNETNKLGKGYVFSEIPNDTGGQEFVDKMKKFFNNKTYKMRVRGQHIKPELRGTGATYWGQTRDESTHLRVYIETKKGE